MSQQPAVIKLFEVHLEVEGVKDDRIDTANYEVRMSRIGVELFKGCDSKDLPEIRQEILDSIGKAIDVAAGIHVKDVTVENVANVVTLKKVKKK